MHRQFADEFAAWLKEERLDPQKVTVFDAFRYFTDMAGNRVPFTTGRSDAVRRLLADRDAHNLFFTDFGVLQVQDLTIDLAPELKELFGTTQRDGASTQRDLKRTP